MVALKDHHNRIKELDAELLCISVDTPEESAKFRSEQGLPFELLADVDQETIKKWDILNSKERGGIAKPNVYIIARDGTIVFHSSDNLASRADPTAVLDFLETYSNDPTHRLTNKKIKFAVPTLKDMMLGIPKKLGWMK